MRDVNALLSATFVLIAAFAVTLLPVLNILPIGADLQNSRLLYLPLAAGAAVLGASVCAGVSLIERFSRVAARVAVWGIVLSYAVLTAVHVGPWIVAAQGVPAILDEFHAVLQSAPGPAQVVVRGRDLYETTAAIVAWCAQALATRVSGPSGMRTPAELFRGPQALREIATHAQLSIEPSFGTSSAS